MDTWKIIFKRVFKTMSFASPWVPKRPISNKLQHQLLMGEQWLVIYMMEKNHKKRTVSLDSNLYVHFNVTSTLGKRELCRKYRDTAITNVKSSHQCISWDKLCSERPKSSNVAAMRHPTVWSIFICVVFSVSISRLHFGVWMHCEITMHYIHGFGYSTFEFLWLLCCRILKNDTFL